MPDRHTRTLSLAALLLPLWLLLGTPAIAGGNAPAERSASLSLPPESLAQWYKPANKRQVWLHTMFSLRRSLQAVTEYAALEEQSLMVKWTERLVESYRSIGKMVPEWDGDLEKGAAERLLTAARMGDFAGSEAPLRRLNSSCRSCHNEYRAAAAALYRSPDFSTQTISDRDGVEEFSYRDFMNTLSTRLNRIKIAMEDGRPATAQEAQQQLGQQLTTLGDSCKGCHREPQPRERILGSTTAAHMTTLAEAIAAGDNKQVNRQLGEIGVAVCARCHAVHRTLSDLRGKID